MTPQELRARTAAFAATMNRFCEPFLAKAAARVAAEQRLRAMLPWPRITARPELSAIFTASAKTARGRESATRATHSRSNLRRHASGR